MQNFDPTSKLKYEHMKEGTNEWTDEWKSENYVPPHTSYVRSILNGQEGIHNISMAIWSK